MSTFPIMKLPGDRSPNLRTAIPLALIAPHEEQAQRNHGGQTLQRLAERGGLSAVEALAVLEDRRWYEIAEPVARQLLEAKVREWEELDRLRAERDDALARVKELECAAVLADGPGTMSALLAGRLVDVGAKLDAANATLKHVKDLERSFEKLRWFGAANLNAANAQTMRFQDELLAANADRKRLREALRGLTLWLSRWRHALVIRAEGAAQAWDELERLHNDGAALADSKGKP